MMAVKKVLTMKFHFLLIAVILSCRVSTANGATQDQYVGCFNDNDQQSPSLTTVLFNDNRLTAERCISKCTDTNYMYAAIQNGNTCLCGNDYGIQMNDSACNMTCSGNATQYCGGMKTYVIYTVCPIGYYGDACDKTCHCNRQIPCDRMSGSCQIGCHGNWTGTTCNTTSISQQYIGCYSDPYQAKNLRVLTECVYCDGTGDLNNNNTLESCGEFCADRNYTYFGTEYSWQCFCGDSYRRDYGDEANCHMGCSGNSSEICGGTYAISIYWVCPVGNYGKDCIGNCNCKDGQRCNYKDGSCPSGVCKTGWKGTSCNIRDCTSQNVDCYENETCSVVDLKYSTVSQCRCLPGFQRKEIWDNCADIDECSYPTLFCDISLNDCTNTIGSYNCTCKPGYERLNSTPNNTCTDIDECQKNASICGNSTLVCINNPGSYLCGCKDGFQLVGNNCVAIVPENNNGVIIGAVVGSILGVALVIAIIIAVVVLHRRRCCLKSNAPETPKTPDFNSTFQYPEQDQLNYDPGVVAYETIGGGVNIKDLPEYILNKLSSGDLEKEFQNVHLETKDPCSVAKNRAVKKKNRFKNIIPYDKNLVTLSKLDNSAFSDYINASYITGYNETDKLIATQGPKPETTDDFWRMICENRVNVIVMVTNLVENGKVKCEKYWPELQESVSYGQINVKTTSEKFFHGYVSREFLVTKDSFSLKITHWQFLDWPDHGLPQDIWKFLIFVRNVRKSMVANKYTVVHCSAGAGRTGSFIAVDYLLKQGQAEGKVDILGCLNHLREQRRHMIQNLVQYKFVHSTLQIQYTTGNTAIPCDRFHSSLEKLQEKDLETGNTKLDFQLQSISEVKHTQRKESKTRVVPKSAALDYACIPGWRKNDVYITLKFPLASSVNDFYALCQEFSCKVIIFLDNEQKLDSIFPSKEVSVQLRSSTVMCNSSSTENYGSCYKISAQKPTNDTYENVTVYVNASDALSNRRDMTVFHVIELFEVDGLDATLLMSLYSSVKKLKSEQRDNHIILLSRSGFLLSEFCLAAFTAFDMISDDNEVDLYQIILGIRKSRPHFNFTQSSYKRLHEIVGQYINMSPKLPKTGATEEPVYELAKAV